MVNLYLFGYRGVGNVEAHFVSADIMRCELSGDTGLARSDLVGLRWVSISGCPFRGIDILKRF